MAAIPQNVLNWLHSVLTNEYYDVQRTFSDVAQALSQYQTLRPRTDVYTFEDGRSSLLLHITGTLPVQFRGATYSFPISLWVPHGYPREGPIAFVTPTSDMAVRPGQHVSGEGRIYHPYLAGWRADRSNLSDLVRILQEIFSREPPVISKNEQVSRPLPGTQTSGIPPSVPPVPPKPGRTLSSSSGFTQSSDPGSGPAPRPPPKPVEHNHRVQSSHTYGVPPVPPHLSISDAQDGTSSRSYLNSPTTSQTWQRTGQYAPQRSSGLRNDHFQSNQIGPHLANFERENLHGPPKPPLPAVPPHIPPSGPGQASQLHQIPPWQRHQPLPSGNPPAHPSQQPTPYLPQHQNHHQSPYPIYAPKRPPPAPKPPEDLLSSPFDNPIPSDSQPANISAPPIPPNPEKDALLSALSQTLTQHLHSAITSNASALTPLRAQRAALQTTLQNLQHEHQSLKSLQALLSSNESILHTAMREADTCIANASHRTVPPVDDVLVAPTVVGEQLYGLVAEERALVEARGVLSRALDRGRVGCEGWVKGVRGLAREEFLKKVLIRKCARGMGLREGEEWG